MSLYLSNLNRITIKNVFMIHQNPNEKIDKEGFDNILAMIDFHLNPKEKEKLVKSVFKYKTEINFEQFLKIFDLDLEEYTPVDVKNAFRLLAKDSDKFVDMKEMEEIVNDMELEPSERKFLLNNLMQYQNRDGQFNYQELLKHFYIN